MASSRPVILIDVDNTLLDNDRFADDFTHHLDQVFGEAERLRYWEIYNALRDEVHYADYLGAVQRFRYGAKDQSALQQLSSWLLDYPFAERFYPGALNALAALDGAGTTVILSDGDMIFQPRKIARSGIGDVVKGRVVIDIHKEKELGALQSLYPADHYVIVDDKLNILNTMKSTLGAKLTTVFVRQGHYAAQAVQDPKSQPADLAVDHIAQVPEALSAFASADNLF